MDGAAPKYAKSDGRFDRLWKTRPLLSNLLYVSKTLIEPGLYIVIDEMMIFSRGEPACCILCVSCLLLNTLCVRTPVATVLRSACWLQHKDANEANA